MRERIIVILLPLLIGLALVDVFTGWMVFTPPVAAACLGGSIALALLDRRRLRLLVACLLAACFVLHLVFSIRADYESGHWDRIRQARVRTALSKAASILDARFDQIGKQVEEAAGRGGLANALKARQAGAIFSDLDRITSGAGDADKITGVVAGDAAGQVLAWSGKLPDFIGTSVQRGGRPGMRIVRSTTHYWVEAYAPVGLDGEILGGVTLYRQLDAIYADVIPRAAPTTLVEELTGQVGHEVRVQLQADSAGAAGEGEGEISRDLRLPDGTAVGRLSVRERVLDDELDLLRGQGLFAASLVVLFFIGLGVAMICRHLIGFRFSKATPVNLLLVMLVLAGARLGLSMLRNFLGLDGLEVFTSVHYATQVTTGILRSPADLMVTGMVLVAGVVLVLLAKFYQPRPGSAIRRVEGHDRLPALMLWLVVTMLAAGSVLAAHRLIARIYADSTVVMFDPSLSGFTPSSTVMRIGMIAGSCAMVLLGGSLIQWQMSVTRRLDLKWPHVGNPYVMGGITLSALTVIFIISGVGAAVAAAAIVCFTCGLFIDLLLRRQIKIGAVGIAVLLTLAVSAIQFPYVLEDYKAKQQDVIESISSRIMVRTDAWKVSVLEEALDQIAGDREIAEALDRGEEIGDALALRIWANSILSKANIISGIHIIDAEHVVVGRFSLEDIGDLSEIEGALRSARFAASPMFMVTRGTFGGREIELYVGVVPFTRHGVYLGSIVISIPYAYSDLESMAGLKPSFFETISGPSPPGYFQGSYAASLISDGAIVATTARDFEVGKHIPELDDTIWSEPGWIRHEVNDQTYASYYIPSGDGSGALLLSLRSPSPGDNVVRCMGVLAGNTLLAFLIIVGWAIGKGAQHLIKRLRRKGRTRLRWSFASKLALGFVLIAIVPTLILGATSRGFLRARLRQVMESKAEEGLKLSRLALERLVGGEATRLAKNPILIDELLAEPSILAMLVSNDVASAVFDSSGTALATFGDPDLPEQVLELVLRDGRSFRFFSLDDALYAKSAVPVRDIIFPNRIKGCAFVSRKIDDGLASRLSSELGREISFFGASTVAASSKRELFVSELMAHRISPDAYLECFVGGRELHFTWDRIGDLDVVLGFSPLRDHNGNAVGAISLPLLFRKDDVSVRMEWTSSAISYLLIIVIGSIFIFGLALARRISKPINDLIQGTLRIGSGDLSFTIPRSGDDEIGDLVSSFNMMTTALAKSRKALSERKRYIETIIGNVGAGIVSTDWKGRIDTFNSAAEKLLGVRARNARGREARYLLKRIGAPNLAAVLDEVGDEKGMARREVNLPRGERGQVTLRAVASAVRGPKGRRMGKVIVFEDVTELIRSKQLIAWSEMARQVAHEIKNPLTPMKLSAQQLLQSHRDGASDFDTTLEESVSTIVEQIESLRRIAVEFSRFSRMPERKLEIADVNEILEDSLGQYERTVGGSIEIGKMLDRSVPKVKIDRDELKRVFLNLIENAVQAMPRGGKLTVRSLRSWGRPEKPEYDFSVTSRGANEEPLRGYVEINMADTGGGIPPGNSAQLFEPNFSTKSHGSGLGLAICKGIMDGYGGEIVIESTAGAGTCARVRIPLPEKPTSRRPPRRRDSRRWRRRR